MGRPVGWFWLFDQDRVSKPAIGFMILYRKIKSAPSLDRTIVKRSDGSNSISDFELLLESAFLIFAEMEFMGSPGAGRGPCPPAGLAT